MFIKGNKGFTLLEVIFALLILGGLGIYFYGYINNCLLTYRNQELNFRNRQQARLALEKMVIDIRSGTVLEVKKDRIKVYTPYKDEGYSEILYKVYQSSGIDCLALKENKNFMPLVQYVSNLKFTMLESSIKVELTISHPEAESYSISRIISSGVGERVTLWR